MTPPPDDPGPDHAGDADAAGVPDAGAADPADVGSVASVPDAGTSDPGWGEPGWGEPEYADSGEFAFLGGEAAVPEREYGPPIASVLPDPALNRRELRELERRVQARVTPAFPIEHRRQVPFEFLWKRYRQVAMKNRSDRVDEFGRDPVKASRIEPLLDFLYRSYFRVAVRDVDRVPLTGRAILVANHAGTLPYDSLMVMHAVRREHPAGRDVRPLIEDYLFHFPYLGTLINRIGGVRACPENAQRLLDSGRAIVVFPEGQKGVGKLYRDRYKLQRFGRGGFVKLALRTRSPIVPVAIVGAEETTPLLHKITWPRGSLGLPYIPITPTFPLLGPLGLLPVPSKWTIRFGPTIDVAAHHDPDEADDRRLVTRLADEVRSTIQTMVDEILATRRSIIRAR